MVRRPTQCARLLLRCCARKDHRGRCRTREMMWHGRHHVPGCSKVNEALLLAPAVVAACCSPRVAGSPGRAPSTSWHVRASRSVYGSVGAHTQARRTRQEPEVNLSVGHSQARLAPVTLWPCLVHLVAPVECASGISMFSAIPSLRLGLKTGHVCARLTRRDSVAAPRCCSFHAGHGQRSGRADATQPSSTKSCPFDHWTPLRSSAP